jgi:PAS domain S-box-containing protein
MKLSDRSKLLAKLVLTGLVYFAAVRFSLASIAATQLWPASAIGLAAILRWGPVTLLATIPAHLLAHLSAGLLPSLSAAAAAAAGAQAAFAAWLLGRLHFDRFLGSPRDVIAFVLAGVIAGPTLGAALGTAGLAWSGQITPDPLLGSLWLWWIGSSVGVLVMTPLLVSTDHLARRLRERRSAPEAALVTGALLLIGLAVFGPWPGLGAANRPISFAVFPVVAWAALRLGPAGAATANAIIAAIAVWGTLGGSGPFVEASNEASFPFTWSFLCFSSIASLVFAALVATRDRTERELREAYEALRALEAATLAGSWIWRPNLSLQLASTRLREIHGVAGHANPIPQEVLLESIHPDDRRQIAREFAAAWEKRGRIEAEYRVVLADGSVRWLAASGACVPVDPTRPAGPLQMVGVHIDVTQRKQMEATVRRGERLVSLGTFAAGVAHELNNPLGTILLAAEAARSSAPDPGLVARALDDIVEDARRAARIVRSVLRFAKQEATERTLLDLRNYLPRAVDLARPYCREHDVALEVRLGPRALEVLANGTEIEQLVQNLVRNAAEACDPGGKVRVEADRAGEEVILTVSDDGRGMTPSELERAFDPFYTTRSREGGSGLGLSICHGIARAHDGRIEIESAAGHGTRVRIWLPSADRDARGATEADHGATPAG